MDDDLYWMYAVMKANLQGTLVTNDNMRNHSFEFLDPKYFSKFRSNHIMHYRFIPEDEAENEIGKHNGGIMKGNLKINSG